MQRFGEWLASPGCTGFTRLAHFCWSFAVLGTFLLFVPVVWFGYACWTRDPIGTLTSGLALVGWIWVSNMAMMVASSMMRAESMIAKREGRDLEF